MECLQGIWIKVISYFVATLILILLGIYFYKKPKNDKKELVLIIVLSIITFIAGTVNTTYLIKPHIEHETVKYIYHSRSGVLFGTEYYFTGTDGKSYDLVLDPISYKKIMNGVDFEKNTYYIIGYESRAEIITSVKTLN